MPWYHLSNSIATFLSFLLQTQDEDGTEFDIPSLKKSLRATCHSLETDVLLPPSFINTRLHVVPTNSQVDHKGIWKQETIACDLLEAKIVATPSIAALGLHPSDVRP